MNKKIKNHIYLYVNFFLNNGFIKRRSQENIVDLRVNAHGERKKKNKVINAEINKEINAELYVCSE
jgi:hypothetical protein